MICEANGLVGPARDAHAPRRRRSRSPEAKWWYRLAIVEARSGRMDEAIADMRRAIEAERHVRAGALAPRPLAARPRRRRRRRARVHRARARSIRTTSRRRWGWRASTCSGGRTRPAADLLERTLAKNPGDRYAMRLLGTAYRRLGRADEAGVRARGRRVGRAAWPDPWTDEMLQFRRGFAVRLKDATQHFVAGRMAEAMACCSSCVRRSRTTSRCSITSARCMSRPGKVDEGVAMLGTGGGRRSRAIRSPRESRVGIPETERSRRGRERPSTAPSPSTRRSAARMKPRG